MKTVTMLLFAALSAAVWGQEIQQTRVDFMTQPEGASVIVDGRDRGLTPLTLFDLAPGRHHIKYRLAGYLERDRFFQVEGGHPLQRSVVLEPEKGLLLLRSEPAGCNIVIDGASIGQTPRLVTTLDAKDVHRVVLRKAGYRPSSFDVKFEGRRPLVRTETMVLDSGIVEIATDPQGAEVVVNGISRGKSPVTVKDIPKGVATVKLILPGFKEEIRELKMNAGDRQTLSVALTGLPGTLSLTSVPEGARFYVNGEFRGKSPVVLAQLTPGTYAVKAELEGYGTQTRTITVDNGSSPREEFRLSNVMGRLEIKTAPPGVQVLCDGRSVGMTRSSDPDAEFSDIFPVENLLEGEHVVTLKLAGYTEAVRHPKIESSKTSQLGVRLKRIFIPDVEIVTDSGTYLGVLKSNSPEYVVIEVKLGIERSFPRQDIRKMRFIKE